MYNLKLKITMKYLRLFKTEAEYLAANKELPNVSYVKDTGNVYYNAKHAIDRSINAPLMNMMYGLGLAENQDYMTYEEAARVTSLNAADFATYEVVNAWELKYFTSLSECPHFYDGGVTTLKYLYLPDHLTTVKSSALRDLGLLKLHYPESVTGKLPNSPVRGGGVGSILYIGPNITSSNNGMYPNGWETIICMSPAFAWAKTTNPATPIPIIYVKDEYVDDYKAVASWSSWGIVKPLSEYTGDTDY